MFSIVIGGNGRSSLASERAPSEKPRWHSGIVRASTAIFCCHIVVFAASVLLNFFRTDWLVRHRIMVGVFWIIVSSPILVFLWGCVSPRKYQDGKRRTGLSHLLGITIACGIQGLLLLIAFGLVYIIPGASSECVIQTATRDTKIFRAYRAEAIADRLIPDNAQDITLYFNPGDWLGGGHAELRCTCTLEELQAFATKQGYAFQNESIKTNANPTTGPSMDGDHIYVAWMRFHPERSDFAPPEYPTEFLAYNYRYGNGGGLSFLYDVPNRTLYATYAHN
jgi:hypothetical protein